MDRKRILIAVAGIVMVAVLVVLAALNSKKLNISSLSSAAAKPASESASLLYSKALDSEAKRDWQAAKALYQQLIDRFPESKDIAAWQKKSEELNIKILFSPAITPRSSLYEIKAGDNLAKIAKQFNTTVELLIKSNNLGNTTIIPGRKIKVWTAPFNIAVDKSDNTLILQVEGEVIKTYIVSTGANNSTPVGNFKVINKLANPTWFKAGAVVPAGNPENILGSRWLGINVPSYGIHGTTEPQNLGKQVTQGCVRMSNHDVEELYTIVPVGAEVTIVD